MPHMDHFARRRIIEATVASVHIDEVLEHEAQLLCGQLLIGATV
jgi:hypothetical protein